MPIHIVKIDPRKRTSLIDSATPPPRFDDVDFPSLPLGPHLPIDVQRHKDNELKREAEERQVELSWVQVDVEEAKWIDVYQERVNDKEEVKDHYALPFVPIGLSNLWKNNKALKMPVHGIFKFPQEVREMIWQLAELPTQTCCSCCSEGTCTASEYQLDVLLPSVYRNGCRPEWPNFLPIPCFVSRWFLLELIQVFLRTTKFVIYAVEEEKFFRSILDEIPDGIGQVRKLQLRYFDIYDNYFGDLFNKQGGRLPNENALDLALDCTGLQTLYIPFTRTGPIWPNDDPSLHELSATEIAKKFRLDRLVRCSNLRLIHITVSVRFVGYRKKTESVFHWLYHNIAQLEGSKVDLSGWLEFWYPEMENRAFEDDYLQDC